MQWYTIAALTLMVMGLTIYVLATTQKCTIFKKDYSNTVTVMLLFSDIKQYVPVKLCQNSRKHSFVSDLWAIDARPNHIRKKIICGI